MSNKPIVHIKDFFDSRCIYINNLIHLELRREGYVGLQSWAYSKRKSYFIEYIYDTTTVLTEYSSRELWEGILKAIDALKE